jgi:hypothetical protein
LELRSFPGGYKTYPFGLVVFCRPTIICIGALEWDHLPDTLAIAISWPRIWADSMLEEKKKELNEHSKDF